MNHTEWAHVHGTAVVNISIGTDPVDATWLELIRHEFDAVVEVTSSRADGLGPQIGWSYDAATGTFSPPPDPEP